MKTIETMAAIAGEEESGIVIWNTVLQFPKQLMFTVTQQKCSLLFTYMWALRTYPHQTYIQMT